MTKPLFLAAISGLVLVSAHPPQSHDIGPRANEARTGYPPCSRSVTDRCIQLHERSARSADNLARNSGPVTVRPAGRLGGDEIDVTYAGNLQTPPRPNVVPPASTSQPTNSQSALGNLPARRGDPAVAVRQTAPAASPRVEQLADASSARTPYPACRAGVSDRCHQQPRHRSNRQLSARVKRAGERG